MTTITTERIGEMLRKVFSSLIDWNPTDEEYAVVDDLQKLIDEFHALPWKAGVMSARKSPRHLSWT